MSAVGVPLLAPKSFAAFEPLEFYDYVSGLCRFQRAKGRPARSQFKGKWAVRATKKRSGQYMVTKSVASFAFELTKDAIPTDAQISACVQTLEADEPALREFLRHKGFAIVLTSDVILVKT